MEDEVAKEGGQRREKRPKYKIQKWQKMKSTIQKFKKKEKKKKSLSNGWPVRKLLLIADRHGQDHTGKRSRFLSVRLLALTIWLSLFFLFSASFYHVSSLQFFWGFVWFGLVLFRFFLRWSRCLSADTRYSARKRKRKRSGKNATSIMACQLSKPFVCCALELTSPTFSQPKPATPPCPQFSAAFFIPILLWVHLFFFCFVGYSDSSRTHLLFFVREIVLEWRDRETTHNYWDMPLSFFFFFYIFIFFRFLDFSFSFLSLFFFLRFHFSLSCYFSRFFFFYFLFSLVFSGYLVYLPFFSCAFRVTVDGW